MQQTACTSCLNMNLGDNYGAYLWIMYLLSLKLTAKAPEQWWLGQYFPFWKGIFLGALAVSFRKGSWRKKILPFKIIYWYKWVYNPYEWP